MPKLAVGGALAVVALLLAAGNATAVEGGDKDQGHVTFCGDDRASGHVDFSIDGDEGTLGSDRGQGHVTFSVEGVEECAIDLCLRPGEDAAEVRVRGSSGESACDTRVLVHPDGRVEVNGEVLAESDPEKGCRISLAWSVGSGAIVVQVDDASGAVSSAQYALLDAPVEVEVAAAEICSLLVTRQ